MLKETDRPLATRQPSVGVVIEAGLKASGFGVGESGLNDLWAFGFNLKSGFVTFHLDREWRPALILTGVGQLLFTHKP